MTFTLAPRYLAARSDLSDEPGGVLQHGHVIEVESDGGQRVDHKVASVLPLDDLSHVAGKLALPDVDCRAHEVGRLLGTVEWHPPSSQHHSKLDSLASGPRMSA